LSSSSFSLSLHCFPLLVPAPDSLFPIHTIPLLSYPPSLPPWPPSFSIQDLTLSTGFSRFEARDVSSMLNSLVRIGGVDETYSQVGKEGGREGGREGSRITLFLRVSSWCGSGGDIQPGRKGGREEGMGGRATDTVSSASFCSNPFILLSPSLSPSLPLSLQLHAFFSQARARVLIVSERANAQDIPHHISLSSLPSSLPPFLPPSFPPTSRLLLPRPGPRFDRVRES